MIIIAWLYLLIFVVIYEFLILKGKEFWNQLVIFIIICLALILFELD